MTTKAALAGVALLIGVGDAMAADLPARYASPIHVIPPPVFTWTGFYAGVNAGGVVDDRIAYGLTGATPANQFSPTTYARGPYPSGYTGGFTGGGQVGVNYQLRSNIVVGFETDAAYTDIDHTQGDRQGLGAGRIFHSRLDFLGTVRGRVGYAFNRLLVYATGGLAYGQTDSSVALTNVARTDTRFGGSESELQTGYAVGGGIEYALPPTSIFAAFGSHAATLKAEYLHYDLGDTTVVAANNPVTGAIGAYNARLATSGDLVRAGLNFKY